RATRERVVVDVELLDSRDEFPRAGTCLAGLEGAQRREPAVTFIFAGDEPRELSLPRGVGQRVGARDAADRARDVLLHLRVLAQESEAAAVVVHLRREAQAFAVCERRVAGSGAGRGVGTIAEHAELSLGAIRRQIGIGRDALQILPGRT